MAQKLKWTIVTLFPLGRLVCTPGAEECIPEEEMLDAIQRHASCDWGDVCEEDRGLNDESLRDGSRLLSAYRSREGVKFWIITEWDRSATTILLPSEY